MVLCLGATRADAIAGPCRIQPRKEDITTESPYPPIAEHGLIGDLQTTALVQTDGTIDFFCCPRVDSPTVFGALLDHEKGGQFTVRARADDVVTKQMYLPDTAVLVTRYLTENGVAELADFMPIE